MTSASSVTPVVPTMAAQPVFINGQLVHFPDLDALGTGIDTLCRLNTGKTAAAGAASKPVCKVNLTGSQSVAASTTGLTVSWNQALYDPDGMWSSGSPDHVTIRTTGIYKIVFQASYASGSASARVAQIFVNGVSDPLNVAASVNQTLGSTGAVTMTVVAHEPLHAGALVYAGPYQGTGGALNLLANGNWGTYMTVAWSDPY